MSWLRWVHRECFGKTSRYEAFAGADMVGHVERLDRIWLAYRGSEHKPVETLKKAKAFVEGRQHE